MCHTCVQRLSSIWELLFRTKKMINSGFFYGKKSMSPLTADDVFKNSTPKSSCQKKNVHSFPVKKSLFHESLLCIYPSNDICMEKSSQNINYSGALRTPKCVSPDSWKSWDISTVYTVGWNIFWNRIWILDCLIFYEIFSNKERKQFY